MNNIIRTLIISMLFFACSNDHNIKSTEAKINSSDTIVNDYETYRLDLDLTIETKDTLLVIDNEKYLLKWTSRLDTLSKYYFTDIYTNEGKIYRDNYSGFNANYTISLQDQLNKKIFSKSFTKDEFKNIFDGDILTRSNARLPDFLGFQKRFDAFAFTIDFWVPESDVGGQCFILINRRGQITENSINNYFGGGDCDGEVTFPPNGEFILTCRKIINANGQVVILEDENIWQIGTKLINDNCILVIKEFNDTTNRNNATLIDNFGKSLLKFSYNGYYNILGNTVPMHFDSLTNNYYLLDEEFKNLRVINKENPSGTYLIDLDKMHNSSDTKKDNEIEFDLNTEINKNTFYVDTLNNSVRLKRQ